ncbi:MAG TPA: molecular chaperone TorD family protein [Bacteroidales bacterium]|nr:molecular chaperone TorD family protein [Bacteroidales bacterium]
MDATSQNNVLKGYNMLLYFAGSMIMFEPNEECITDFWTKGILRSLPVSSANPTFLKAASQLRESCMENNFSGKKMHEDYTRLFAREGSSLAPAFESLYRNHTPPGAKAETVTEFYKAYGWESKFRGKISDDHLGVELLFLTLMVEKYLEFDDEACKNEMKNEIRRFINKHILSWIREWNKDVQAHSKTLSFKGVGTLILACSEDLLTIFKEEKSSKSLD